MSRYTPPTIDSYGGISPYLDAEEIKKKHNGHGSDELKKMWNWGEGKHMNVSALAILYDVTWSTMDGWLDRLHADVGKPRPGKTL